LAAWDGAAVIAKITPVASIVPLSSEEKPLSFWVISSPSPSLTFVFGVSLSMFFVCNSVYFPKLKSINT
jgi:hypothetical protein